MRKKGRSIRLESEGAYLSDISSKDKAWDRHRANSDVVRDTYQSLGYDRYPERINDCSRLLEFVLKEDFNQRFLFKLQSARFCRVRFCPVCQWRKSMMWRSRFFRAIPPLRADHPNVSFISLTLTVKNCEVENLKETINWMNQSFYKLVRRKAFPGLGWVKSTEVTAGKNRSDLSKSDSFESTEIINSKVSKAHPHFHCIIIVPNSYFKSRKYLSKDKWIKLWQKSLKVDYLPSIKVNKVYLTKKREQKIGNQLGRELTDDEKVFYGLIEGLKYSVKESDLTADPYWLDAITKQLHNTRAISMGGIFKQYLSEDEPEDLIHVELEEDIEMVKNEAEFLFGWKEKVKRYQSV